MLFLLPLLLLIPLSATLDVFAYPAASCTGPAVGCFNLRPGSCCTSYHIPYVSVRTITPNLSGPPGSNNNNLRHYTCAYPLCSSVCIGPSRADSCINPPWALFSARITQDREAPYIPSTGSDDGELVEYHNVPATTKDKCVEANVVLYLDVDGNEVVAEIPEGRRMEVLGAVERGDVGLLRGLGGEKRVSVPFEVVELRGRVLRRVDVVLGEE